MTGMLASVSSVSETRIVRNAGVDIIDIKNPYDGALGALDLHVIKKIVQLVNGETLTSATIGDIKADDPELLNYIISMSGTGVDYVKVGLFDNRPSDYFINVIKEATVRRIKLVIVLFAENYQGIDSIRPLMQAGITGIMLDTRQKKSKNLCAILDNNELQEFVSTAKEYRLITGLAGSLKFENISTLLIFNPDYLGFRGALCSGNDRIKSISEEQVKKIRDAIPQQNTINFRKKQSIEAITG